MMVLVIGLIAVAAVLDFGFRTLQARLAPAEDPWQAATVEAIERALLRVAPAVRAAEAERLGAAIGLPVQLLARDSVVGPASDAEGPATNSLGIAHEDLLADASRATGTGAGAAALNAAPLAQTLSALETDDGSRVWLADSTLLNGVLRIGPVPAPPDQPWLRLIPPLFYFAIAALVFVWLRPLLKDLDTITASTRSFAADYREQRPTAPAVSNLKELAENYDAMAERLSGLIQGQKELTSALSHEMRTPLARIRFALAVVNDQSHGALQADLAAIESDVQEVDRLITTMLNYARLDHPDTEMHWDTVPAGAWLAQIVDKASLPETEVNVAPIPDSIELQLDPRLMELAVSNLVVNACRHAQQRVKIWLTTGPDSHRIAVEDDGPGIPAADRTDVFKAFTRLDNSRSRDTGGFGLGLAIVARIATLHGGTVTAGESTELGGAAMTLTWPPRP